MGICGSVSQQKNMNGKGGNLTQVQPQTNSKNEVSHVQETGYVRTTSITKSQNQLTAKSAEVFLISCMDFRLLDDIVIAMDELGYNNNYDQFMVAGSSLGLMQEEHPDWAQTCIEHMEIAVDLHSFGKVMVIDHEDCCEFKKAFPELVGNLELERQYHREHIQKLYDRLIKLFPQMIFESYLMNLAGDIDPIEVVKSKDGKVKRCISEKNADEGLKVETIDHPQSKSIQPAQVGSKANLWDIET